MVGIFLEKKHDEARQGSAFQPNDDLNNAPHNSRDRISKKFYIESYGCAMNFADSEIIASILQDNGFGITQHFQEADMIFINTCSIREKAELTVRKRLSEFTKVKKYNPGLLIGVLGCMAERLKSKFIEEEKLVDIVVGPDAYRTLPVLIEEAESGQKGVNVLLSREETYGDISPIRLNSNGVTAFVSIMRGCNNMCSFCVVPFTRGRERSRNPESIIKECEQLFEEGYREVTLLGQNVDSYSWQNSAETTMISFANLLEKVAMVSPLLRVRFSTSHPKDITDQVLFTMAKYENICKYIHLPVQSGSTRILQLMNRTYTRDWYIGKVDRIRELLPGCGISTDMITGFCTETEEDHQETMRLMEYCEYELAYMYYYSERPGTLAERRFEDDVPLEIKKRRLQEIVNLHRIHSLKGMQKEIGKTHKVLIEGDSKKSDSHWAGRSDNNKVVVFPKKGFLKKSDYTDVIIESCTAGTLIGK
ncbi:MAG TPA: tRNA (N6-isopentenyl adenosine(37)-C2)-methylthiotransferase MiaB [Chitinophagaceae bacterium]|nr:tRNA (N6-isopentenyl adenosine(37)-C2)-methylthiotransferase MiaB [Chitinophagaceae bacterium]